MKKLSKKQKKIIVNALTCSRLIGALSMPLIFNLANIPALIGLIGFLFFTDFLDGKLARKWKVQTRGGALLDPLGDKLLAASCIISLLGGQNLLLVPLFFELAIAGLNVERTLHGEEVKSSIIGKIKTFALSITLVLGAIKALDQNLLNVLIEHLDGVMPSLSSLDLTVTEETMKTSVEVTAALEAAAFAGYAGESIKNRETRSRKIEELKSTKEMLERLFDEEKFAEDKDLPLIKILKK